jgi:hypothetical protein
METTNLSTKSVNAPASSFNKNERVTHLTKKGIWDLRDKFTDSSTMYKDENIVV